MKDQGAGAASVLRGVGRAALWAVLALLLARGAIDVLSPAESARTKAPGSQGDEKALDAFAVRFARTYLADPDPAALQPMLAAGARVGRGRPPSARGAGVAQAEVVRSSEVGDGRVIVTVACELRDSRTLYLAVPIVGRGAGEVAALGAPSVVAAPSAAGVEDPERPRPPAGPEAAGIESLVAKFLPAYLSAGNSSELAYLLAPGAQVVPLGGALELRALHEVDQLGPGEGPRRNLIAYARVRDPISGAAYSLAYRLEVVRRDRWYLSSVQGALR